MYGKVYKTIDKEVHDNTPLFIKMAEGHETAEDDPCDDILLDVYYTTLRDFGDEDGTTEYLFKALCLYMIQKWSYMSNVYKRLCEQIGLTNDVDIYDLPDDELEEYFKALDKACR